MKFKYIKALHVLQSNEREAFWLYIIVNRSVFGIEFLFDKHAISSLFFFQKRALLAEQETEKAYQEIDNLKKTYEKEILLLNQFPEESRLPKEAPKPAEFDDPAAAENGGRPLTDQRWIQEFEPFCHEGDNEFSKGTDPNSWFSGYDRCNI